MTDFVVPCEAFARLAKVIADLPVDIDPVFRCIRLDDGNMISTDRSYMAIEHVGKESIPGLAHIVADAALVAQCLAEATFNSDITFTVSPELGFTIGKTSLGYITGNVGYFPPGATDFDRWRGIVALAKGVTKNKGGMFFNAAELSKLAASSPSGRVVFAEKIDPDQPTIVRDVIDGYWLGVFSPKPEPGHDAISPATVQTWLEV